MNPHFQVVGLAHETFAPLFALSDEALAARNIVRKTVDEEAGTPCRVSLEDARPGETVLLLNHLHHDVATPYRASGPIYVREKAQTARLEPGEIPAMLERRLLSLRAYDAAGMLVDADVLEGTDLRGAIERAFTRPEIAYLHVHNARPGCFNCRIDRAP